MCMCFIWCSTTNNIPSSQNNLLVKVKQYCRLSDYYSIFGGCEWKHINKKGRRKEGNEYDHHCTTYVTKYLLIPTNPQKSINLYNTKNFVCYVLIICTSFLTILRFEGHMHTIMYSLLGVYCIPALFVVRLFTIYLM